MASGLSEHGLSGELLVCSKISGRRNRRHDGATRRIRTCTERVRSNTPCHLTRTRVLDQPRGDTRPQPALAALVPRSRAAAQPPHARAPRRYERRTRARPRGRRARRRRRADERQLQGAPSLPSLPPFSPTLLSPGFTLVSHPCLPPLPPTRASRPSRPLPRHAPPASHQLASRPPASHHVRRSWLRPRARARSSSSRRLGEATASR